MWWRIGVIGAVAASLAVATAATGRTAGLQAQQANNPPAKSVIAGRVVDARSGAPIAGAAVTLRPVGPSSARRASVSDSDGHFEFSGLTAGHFSLSARAAAYLSGDYGALFCGDSVGNRIELRAAERLEAADVKLWPTGSISGKVADEHAEAVVGFWVRVLRQEYARGQTVWRPSGSTHTDDRGQFWVGSLRPGKYTVVLPAEPPKNGISVVDHETVFYDSARSASDAQVITLNPGESRGDVNLTATLRVRADRFSVSGHITVDGSRPPLVVHLVRRGSDASLADIEGFMAWPDREGRFTFRQVPPGDYQLRASLFPTVPREFGATLYDGVVEQGKPLLSPRDFPTLVADMPLSVTKSITDLQVPLQPGARIIGRVLIEGRSDLPRPHPLAGTPLPVLRAEGQDISMRIPIIGLDTEGRFETVGLPPGNYFFRTYASVNGVEYVLSSLRVAGREALGVGLEIGLSDLSDVVLTMSGRRWELSGVVRDRTGRLAPAARVIVFPRNREQWQVVGFDQARQVGQVVADRSGAFQAAGAIAGDYLAAAVTVLPEFWMAPEYLETLVPYATPVRLELDGKRTVELRLR